MSYSIIQADLKEHRNEIISLWKRNFQDVPEERYSWIYENNPYGLPVCYLINHVESNSVVGAVSLFPRRFSLFGKPINASVFGDLSIVDSHRSQGLGLSIIRSTRSICDGIINSLQYAFPSEQSKYVFKKAKYETLVELLDMTKVLRSRQVIHKYITHPIVEEVVCGIIDFFINSRLEISYHRSIREYSFEVISSFDYRFDELWEKISTQFSLIGERTSTFLNWRFCESPYDKIRIFCLTSKDGSNILGYLVFSTYENRVTILDLAVLNNNRILNILIKSFSRYQRSLGNHSIAISIAGSSSIISQLKKNGFITRNNRGKIFYIASSDIQELLTDANTRYLYITSGDNDI